MRLRLTTLCLAAALVALSGCATTPAPRDTRVEQELLEQPQVKTEVDKLAESRAAGDQGPISLSSRSDQAKAPPPEIEKGTGQFINDEAAKAAIRSAPAEDGQLTFNFENQPIQAVAKAILGDLLQLNYVIAPGVQGNVSFSTSKPIKADQAMSILEMLLSWTNNSLVFSEGRYTVLPTKDALPGKLTPRIAAPSAAKGYEVRVFPLRFVSPKEMEKLLKPYAKSDAFVSVDTSRSMLVLAGTATELENYQRTIDIFDVDWLKGMSIGVYTIVNVEVAKIMPELDKLFGATGESPMAGMFRFVPIERTNSVIVITPNPDYLAQAEEWLRRLDQGGSESGTQLYVYDVKNVKSVDLADRLNEVFTGQSSGGSSRKTSRSGSVAPGLQAVEVRGMNDNSRRAEQAREKQAASANAPAQAAASFTIGDDESEVRITAVEENNQILVMANQSQWGIIQSAIKRLDVEPLQVQIETKILEVKLVGNLQYGVRWYLEGLIGTSGTGESRYTHSQPGNQQRGLFGANAIPTAGSSNVFYSFINNEIEVAINALQSDSNTKTLSAPSLVVLNNKEARINVGDQIPVVQNYLNSGFGSTLNSSGNSVSTTSYGAVQFRDVGVILTVTPRVNPGGLVYMEVSQEVSAKGEQDTTGNYTVAKREIETEIAVQSGQTVLLGGLIGESEIAGKNGVPGLSKIPLIGNLFGTTNKRRDRTELIIMITPRVVSSASEARDITDEYQRRLQSLAPIKNAGGDTLESAFGGKKK
ncbi:type II secretion system secretin GspD [Tahibacter amnicola]|uniref:Type II secretion system secretin GspD n=1 Tax=Tahibacter amnicola TaxID=2976241 RepID=A0ABY6BIV7_9GAMM|nr:type II secretion system secretin GspD [Tahibacter amnicola]UXI67782.1 type II secretion system secretin GspD [Tahibacter amnicola]